MNVRQVIGIPSATRSAPVSQLITRLYEDLLYLRCGHQLQHVTEKQRKRLIGTYVVSVTLLPDVGSVPACAVVRYCDDERP